MSSATTPASGQKPANGEKMERGILLMAAMFNSRKEAPQLLVGTKLTTHQNTFN